MHTTSRKIARKIKKSFSISAESESFIRKTCKERKSTSESETLDALLSELMEIRQQQAIASAYGSYYDSLSDEDMSEQNNWGKFSESELAKEIR